MTDKVREIIKRPGCRVIRLISGDSMTVPLPVFKKAPLSEGQEVIPEAYRQRVLPMEAALALEQASRMLMTRDRTEAEIRRKLSEAGYAAETVEKTLAKLLDAKIINDKRYVENYLNMKTKRLGMGRIRRELTLKGIQPDAIETALGEIDQQVQLEAAVKHAQKALARKNSDIRHQNHLVFAALARRGFQPEVAKKAIEIARSRLQQQEADSFTG
ncbi:MAG: regulatory protein RecX [Christensenellales bacterium]|jgi:regulatory protein